MHFAFRHFGNLDNEIREILAELNFNEIDDLINETIPKNIQCKSNFLSFKSFKNEYEAIQEIKLIAQKNIVSRNFIGQGYYGTFTPSVIIRNIFENPAWYTAYTPYQAEISQGRLEMLLNFQTLICELTGFEIANASLLDEATAAAEAMVLLYNSKNRVSNKFFVSTRLFKQIIDVLITRADPLGIQLIISDDINEIDSTFFGAIFSYPDSLGEIIDYSKIIPELKKQNVSVVLCCDLLSLCLLKSPFDLGADIAVGSSQRFGQPMGYGGPHAAFFATKGEYKRLIPGRIIGISYDAHGNIAYRMALQTREQHIKREKATSNICTSQVLLAIISAAYAIYHGAEGLVNIAKEIHEKASSLSERISNLGFIQVNSTWFDTLTFVNHAGESLFTELQKNNINVFDRKNGQFSLSVDEVTTQEDISYLLNVLSNFRKNNHTDVDIYNPKNGIPSSLLRTDKFLDHPTFKQYRTEHGILRYLKYLENKDLSMVHGMIPLGSCTMKLNATTELLPISMDNFKDIHPFAPEWQVQGYHLIFNELKEFLSQITGLPAVSLQPNSGAQGEFAGLMVIRAYHKYKNQGHRNIALIPASAHGTNPASAVMAGMKVVVVPCDEKGNISINELRILAEKNKENLACLMITYPSTHGVFEEDIKEICDIVHQFGGLVYMDGANMNAQVGLTNPAIVGADVCHLNLHKTFCIPHGGGGPGMGPICVTEELADFLPGHAVVDLKIPKSIHAVSASPYGSALILLIPYMYIKLMGPEGLKNATKMAILKANYLKNKLQKHYPILYTGKNETCAHEFIIDCRSFKMSAGIDVEDIAKRLMDYGFHAPTVSFPVPGTMMIEPTESESIEEINRFAEALILIRKEIEEIEKGIADRNNNVLKNAPHTQAEVCSDTWVYPYSREKAAFPALWTKKNKFWPSVKRIDGAYGDRNIVCSCLAVEYHQEF